MLGRKERKTLRLNGSLARFRWPFLCHTGALSIAFAFGPGRERSRRLGLSGGTSVSAFQRLCSLFLTTLKSGSCFLLYDIMLQSLKALSFARGTWALPHCPQEEFVFNCLDTFRGVSWSLVIRNVVPATLCALVVQTVA